MISISLIVPSIGSLMLLGIMDAIRIRRWVVQYQFNTYILRPRETWDTEIVSNTLIIINGRIPDTDWWLTCDQLVSKLDWVVRLYNSRFSWFTSDFSLAAMETSLIGVGVRSKGVSYVENVSACFSPCICAVITLWLIVLIISRMFTVFQCGNFYIRIYVGIDRSCSNEVRLQSGSTNGRLY